MALGLYIHIPYCVKKCPYCDFNSYGVGGIFPEKDYTETLLRELEFYEKELLGKRLTSIFFGGGTPSLFDPRNIEKILLKIFEMTSHSGGIEISLEVNPKTSNEEKLRDLLRVGINRVSVGVQSFSDRKLEFLGRINSPMDSRKILDDIVRAGFSNYNLDLMYGTGGETITEWEDDLREAVRFGSTHISAYCLTIENGTEFGRRFKAGRLILPSEETLSGFISYTTDFLEDSGYGQYEISNYAICGYECRHNLLYWKGEDYLGIGAGAHSHIKNSDASEWGMRWGNLRSPALYMKAVGEGRMPLDFIEELSWEEAFEDQIIMGFRLNEGIDISSLRRKYGAAPSRERLEYLSEDGFIEFTDKTIRLTRKGALLSDEIIMRLTSSLE